MEDYYKILDVPSNASSEEIKKAYQSLIRKWHPDKHLENKEEAEQKSKLLNIAYVIINLNK